MQDFPALCQPATSKTGPYPATIEHLSEYSGAPKRARWEPSPAETVAGTASRWSAPRAWRRALDLSIPAGLIPGATAATLAVAHHLAGRMDYTTGHVRYLRAEVMRATGLSKSAVSQHIALLRAAGWLAWVEHGSLRNVLDAGRRAAARALGLSPYARTATVYAATIPAVYDQQEGNVLDGAGYGARIDPVRTARARAAAQSSENDPWTPSRWVVRDGGDLDVETGNETSTGQARTAPKSPRSSRKRTLTVTGYKITAKRIQEARRLAPVIRPLVNWLQGARLDELSWVLLDMVARGWSQARIVLWLRDLGRALGTHRWRPVKPHRMIAAALLADDRAEKATAELHGPTEAPAGVTGAEFTQSVQRDRRGVQGPNAEFQQAVKRARDQHGFGGERQADLLAVFPQADQVPESTLDRGLLMNAARQDPDLVIGCARVLGRDEALRLYGTGAADILDTYAAGLGVAATR